MFSQRDGDIELLRLLIEIETFFYYIITSCKIKNFRTTMIPYFGPLGVKFPKSCFTVYVYNKTLDATGAHISS